MTDSPRELTQALACDFFNRQLQLWPEVASRFALLNDTMIHELQVDDFNVRVQYNPNRRRSSSAKVDAASIASRPCFLCDANRPKEQIALPVVIEKGKVFVKNEVGVSTKATPEPASAANNQRAYKLLVNPFPICRFHLTIPNRHCPQRIAGRITDMVAFASAMPSTVLFYNGPRCGASAPDHFHFQAVDASELPIVEAVKNGHRLPFDTIVLDTADNYKDEFNRIVDCLPRESDEDEPKMNILCFHAGLTAKIVIIPRRAHRTDFFGDGPGQMLVSPACIDFGGLFVASRPEDFEAFTLESIREIYRQLAFPGGRHLMYTLFANRLPRLAVGIVEAATVDIELLDGFSGHRRRHFASAEVNRMPFERLLLNSENNDGRFRVKDVVIGKNFHWQQAETQEFTGNIELSAPEPDRLWLINHVDVETYLRSVISSEMSATAPLEFLKAHAVISRSWVLAQILNRKCNDTPEPSKKYSTCGNPDEIIRWYDHSDHRLFDVCADDHCQRYQGTGRQVSDNAREAVDSTRGCVLTSDGMLCDARFSKCCGGVMEQFSTCWDNTNYPYLSAKTDTPKPLPLPGLEDEATFRQWVVTRPDAFCNTTDSALLRRVLNNYDTSTTDFFRWEVTIKATSLARLIHHKENLYLGSRILDLIPLQRGPSGRIYRLKIVGDKRSIVVGKELEIRRLLSHTHLYSSAFSVEKTTIADKGREEAAFTLRGAGWGHGVGLCQIGAAVMGDSGYNFLRILQHYYPGASLQKLY